MTVAKLIERLSQMDPEARVFLMTQSSWPFEYSIYGVTERREFEDTDEDEVVHGALPGNDVFICEGEQLRYGNKDAWNIAW